MAKRVIYKDHAPSGLHRSPEHFGGSAAVICPSADSQRRVVRRNNTVIWGSARRIADALETF
jgi:hypothetical protein